MSIPKKGSRSIEVDGVSYRWAVRQKEVIEFNPPISNLTLMVERTEKPRTTLVVFLREPMGANGIAITPDYVTRVIRRALQLGWKRDAAGSAFELEPIPLPLPEND